MRKVNGLLRRTHNDDDGRIMLLSIVYGAVTLALVLVVVAVSAIYLERKELFALADAMAADAADAVDDGVYYATDGGAARKVPLTDASVLAATHRYLERAPASVTDFEDFAVVPPTGTPDGDVSQVTLTARVRPPLLPWALMPFADGFHIQVTAFGEPDSF